MKRLLMLAFALCLLWSAAGAETCYTVLPGEMNMAEMVKLTFGDRVSEAVLTERRDDGEHTDIYDLPGTDGPPFCSASRDTAVQARFYMVEESFLTGKHEPFLYENVISSGAAALNLTKEEAVAQTEDVMTRLGLGDYVLQCVTACGQLSIAAPDYKVTVLQRLNHKPVYWSASSRNDMEWGWVRTSNLLNMIWDDSGLVHIEGCWSRFEPTGDDMALITEKQAAEALVRVGENADAVELCYLMVFDGVNAAATPAYRYQNRFVNAFTGEILQ